MKNLRLIFLFFLFFQAREAFAFPEMVRHGYVHCTACHTHLVGGQLLTEYGRSLSRELLSQQTLAGRAAIEGDEAFLYGTVKPPPWLLAGGDIRLLQTFVESSRASRGRFLIMQIDFDFLARVRDGVQAFFSVGRIEAKVDQPKATDFITSPRYGLIFDLSSPESEERWTLRMGRFMPAYGINFAEHTFITRRLLDFQPGQERLAAELAWVDERSSVIATVISKRASGIEMKDETGGAIQYATTIGDKSKVGINYYQTERDDGAGKWNRRVYGAFAHLYFNEKWYGLLELDRPQGVDEKWGLIELFKLGYEIHQGLHFIGVHEFSAIDTEKPNPKFEGYSVGAQWFPRPHWDLYGLFRYERDTAVMEDFQKTVWLIGHFYF